MKFQVKDFAGMRPKADPRLLNAHQAELARNCDLQSGSIVPIESPSTVDIASAGPIRGLYYHNGTYRTWTTLASVCRSPISNDSHRRIYVADGVLPKVIGMLENSERTFTLGIPRPESRPVVRPVVKSDQWTQVWKYFYEEDDGTRKDEGTFFTGAITANATNTVFTLQSTNSPPRITASATSKLVVWMEGFDQYNQSMGVLYTAPSTYTTNNTLVVNGATITCTRSWNTGFTVLTMTLVPDTSGSAGVNYNVDRYYLYTYVSEFGEEGPPSDPSALVVADGTQNVLLSSLRGAPYGYDNITKIRIYRTVAGTNGATFRYVNEISAGNEQYLDQTPDIATGEELQSEGWDTPPDDLTGIRMTPGGFMAGWSAANPRTLLFSEPNHPHAWPAKYALSMDHDIVGLGLSGNTVVVCTKGFPYIVTGDDPASMTKSIVPIPQACTSRQGIAEHENAVIYPSPDGLVLIDGANGRLLTTEYYSRTEWQELQPATMLGGIYDNRYHGFADGGNIIFGLTEGTSALTMTDQKATAIYNDYERDLLVIAFGTSIMTWRTSSTKLTAIWKSRVIDLQRPWTFSVARVQAKAYPVTMRIYMDGLLEINEVVEDDQAFRLPTAGDAKNWQLELESVNTVDEVTLSTSMMEL